jgi:hypothetical protein
VRRCPSGNYAAREKVAQLASNRSGRRSAEALPAILFSRSATLGTGTPSTFPLPYVALNTVGLAGVTARFQRLQLADARIKSAKPPHLKGPEESNLL